MSPERSDLVAIFLHSGEYDRLHQGCSIAATAAATGRKVHLYFFWYALEALLAGQLAQPRFPGREDIAERFEQGSFPTAQALLDAAKATGNCTTFACTASSTLVGARPDRVAEVVDHHVGWASILDQTRGVTDRFYL